MSDDYGQRDRSAWGDGDLLAPYAVGDIVDIPADSPAFTDGRIPHSWSKHPELCQPGRYVVVCGFSIGEGDDWYFRVAPVEHPEESSDRIHIIAGLVNYAKGWTLVESADPENVREVPDAHRRGLIERAFKHARNLAAAAPQACPVCGGRGWMPIGFFTGMTMSTSTTPESCRPCSGSGLIWSGEGG